MAKKDPNTIMSANSSYANGANGPVTNLEIPAAFGYTPDFRYYHAAADYTRRPTIAFLMELPNCFKDTDDAAKWGGSLKALIEMHSRTIDGLDYTLEVEHVETPFGGGGEMMQTLSKVRRARSVPVFTWVEKIGMPVSRFWNNYILYFMGEPNSNVAGIIGKGGITPAATYPDYNTFSVLFVEPDPTERYALRSTLITNMQPTGQGPEMRMSKDQTSSPEQLQISQTFTGLQMVGRGVDKLGQMMLDRASQTGIDLNAQPAFLSDREADVAARTDGYIDQLVSSLSKPGVAI